MNTLIKTTCPYCGVGCGLVASVDTTTRAVSVQGDADHPANFGRLCSKGSALADTLALSGRLLTPQLAGKATTWDTALNTVANTFKQIIAQYGPEAVAFYGSGQLLTEDYYVANKLMKGFIGSGNIDTNSRLCMSSSVAGHKRAFGSDTVPGCYADIELANMLVLIGSNAAWCHPVLFQRMRAAKVANPELKIVVIDPRQTASCDIADLHLPLAPGTDAQLFAGLLHYLQQQGWVDPDFIQQHTEGYAQALAVGQLYGSSPAQVAQQCQLAPEDVLRFFTWFGQTERVISLYSQGINQSASGTDKVNAIINCHLATGRIGKPGMGPLSLTGQPNAMGGREVGGLANQLAAHMDFSNPAHRERVGRFWGSTTMASQPGYPAVELFDAIHAGKVKAVWIMGTNPVVSLPNADNVRAALQRCPLVVVSDCVQHTDTTALAHVLLPAVGWSEKDGTVTNSERRISRQRALLPAAGEAKPDWWIITQVARLMGFADAFAYNSAADIFREHAALSAFENTPEHGLRDFDLSGLATLSDSAYQQLQPIQWPVNADYPNGRSRLFDSARFFTPSQKAQFIASMPRVAAHIPDTTYPLVMNTGRLRDQWHTMTRTALAPQLNQHRPEVFVAVNPQDAQQAQVKAGSLAYIESAWGSMLARVQVSAEQQPGSVFVPMHWSQQWTSQGRMGALVNPVVDPVSFQPASKSTPVRIRPYQPQWHGLLWSRLELDLSAVHYWSKSKCAGCYVYRLADDTVPSNWQDWARQYLTLPTSVNAHWQEYQDTGSGSYRTACIVDNNLQAMLCSAPASTPLPDSAWVSSLFTQPALDAQASRGLLSCLPPVDAPDAGSIVCACFSVGAKTIHKAIQEQQLTSVQAVGKCLKAGTNCGSCIPEISAALLAHASGL